MSDHLLDDKTMAEFIARGYALIQTNQAPEFHRSICANLDKIYTEEGNPGNNILPRLPEIREVFSSAPVAGALTSLLGPGYSMHPHRYCHLNRPGTEGQNWHKDDYVFDQNVRHHRFRWVMAFYYPQDVTEDMGATGILPGRQFYNSISSNNAADSTEQELKLCGPAGTVALVNFDVWHRATANTSQNSRYMLKFQFLRMQEPEAPTWNQQTAAWPEVAGDEHPALCADVWHWLRGASRTEAQSQVQPQSGQLPLPQQLEALDDASETRRLHSVYALSAAGGDAVDPLVDALRLQARGLSEEDLGGDPANPQGNNPAELSAAYALAAVGEPAVGPLMVELQHADWRVRAAAADVLGNMGRAALKAAHALRQILTDDNMWVRRNAAEALGNLAACDTETVARLTAVLGDDDERVRRNAALALAKMGPAASGAEVGLIERLADENRYVRHNAILALQRIATPEALQVLWDEMSTSRWCPITTKETQY